MLFRSVVVDASSVVVAPVAAVIETVAVAAAGVGAGAEEYKNQGYSGPGTK